ncbi:6,7-dimethyl-8-ribityllumazine synthase [Rhodoligotrophos appendicifer]|uniref:6,7-dimethyl-8-ribityllumazine synthase n=1 Tax=Rhodoligotrophos appendicifer TaxID=987056 RepID=UPI00118470DE|nr:6,7-dimethyl-8-ribityllumazine synthase [Rhodoligotrophos appendicifer]
MAFPRILIIEARFYDELLDEMVRGAVAAIEAEGGEYELVTVPGALEIPAIIAYVENGRRQAFDGYVALGCVIRGETHHFDIVANESARALMDLSVNRGLAIANGILTVEDDEQAWARARVGELNKGGAAAMAAIHMARLRAELQG